MHDLITRGLEDYLSGSAGREFDSHLAQCADCREEVEGIRRVTGLLSALRSEEVFVPSIGFSARLVRSVRQEEGRSFWRVFSVDPGFARKLVFGSLLSLAILGSYLATQPEDTMAQADHTPEAVLSSHDPSTLSQQQHTDGMLMTLADYHQ
jgi:hypothetical protein